MRNISLLTIAWLLIVSFFLAACSSTHYHEIQPARGGIKELVYFRWENPPVGEKEGENALAFDKAFRNAIEEGMKQKGFVLSQDKAQFLVDYRIAVYSTSPGQEPPLYEPAWTRDDRGAFHYTGWNDPKGTGDMLEHGVVTLSFRSTTTTDLLWEGGVSRLLEAGVEEVDVTDAAHLAARHLIEKIPAH